MNTTHSTSIMSLVGVLLREPERLLADPDAHDEREASDRLAVLAPRLLAITVFTAALFGVVLGSYRGDIQYLYAALKTPLLLLAPVLIGLPAIRAFHGACEVRISWSALALSALVAMARTAVLAAACGPVLWLYLSLHPDYHHAVLAMVAALCCVAGPGLAMFLRSMPKGGRQRQLTSVASAAILGLLLAQSGWLLRPFVVRPTAEITFLRPIEANVFSSLATTGQSAQGNYGSWEAESVGLFGRSRQSPQPAPQPQPQPREELQQ